MKNFLLLTVALFCSLSYGQRINRLYSVDKILEIRKKAIFKIDMYDNLGKHISSGTGFFINKDGLAVTNFHVLFHANNKTLFSKTEKSKYINMNYLIKTGSFQYKFTDKDGNTLKGGSPKIIGCGNKNNIDACLLKFNIQKTAHIPTDAIKVGKGNKVLSIGYCGGSLNIKKGNIINYYKDFLSLKNITNINYNLETKMIQVSNPICPGDSGGPIFSSNGDLVGMTTIRFKNNLVESNDANQWINLGILIQELKKIKKIKPYELLLLNLKNNKKLIRPSDPFHIP